MKVCACQPGEWKFTFDFSRTDCSNTNIVAVRPFPAAATNPNNDNNNKNNKKSGISSIECTHLPPDDRYQLRVVDFARIREQDSQYNWIIREDEHSAWPSDHDEHSSDEGSNNVVSNVRSKRTKKKAPENKSTNSIFVGPFYDGQSLTYTSVTKVPPIDENGEKELHLPSAITVHLYGKNGYRELCEFIFTLYFSNDCSIFPVVENGYFIGPVTVTSVSDPPRDVCPLVN